MTSRFRAIRFARADAGPSSLVAGATLVASVRLDEQPDPAGQILRRDGTWEYLLADGSSSGLTSALSRHDLERQIVLFHLGTVPSDDAGDAGAVPPYRMAS